MGKFALQSCFSGFYDLLYTMEQKGRLDCECNLDMFALHYVFQLVKNN